MAADERAHRLAQLSGVEQGLCFGRIDHQDRPDGPLYIGRIGLRDADHEVMLVDWRAPAARAFYAATPQSPNGLSRRRHLHTRGRTVVGIDDEVFDLDGLSDDDRSGLVGEAALLAALRTGRTGRMHDIVATIQGEQDRVIRSKLQGILVVQGGPGTGKTVAALHRAAYLLYTHRQTLERRGVLVVGPNPAFLRYIGQVLPSLGETDVVLTTVGGLFPGAHADTADDPDTAVLKGSLRMVGLIRAAVRDRQRVPRGGLRIRTGGMDLAVLESTCANIRDRARDLGLKHNVARTFFITEMLSALAHDQQERLERSMREAEEAAGLPDADSIPELEDPDAPLWSDQDIEAARETLWSDPGVQSALDALWPLLTPQRLVGDLLCDPELMATAAAEAEQKPQDGVLAEHEWRALLRPAGAEWTLGDIPLLDEAAELLGADPSAQRARERAAERERLAEERYAQGVLEFTGLFEDQMMGSADLADRHRDFGPPVTTAERAAQDRTWAYGHVIVDEAQELSEMAWRTVMRRIPTRSLTVVGDLAQTGSAAGARSWSGVLERYANGRLHQERLLVNYRTPAEIMEVAADVLKAVAPEQEPPESVRDGDTPPRAVPITASDLPRLVAAELEAVGKGRAAVIVPDARHHEIAALLPEAATDTAPGTLDSPVALLTATQSKGLEFDSVIVVDPAGIIEASPKGGHDLYVAITRTTRRLTVAYEGDLPTALGRLAPDLR